MTSAFHTPHCCSSGFFVSAQVPLATQTITTSLVFMHCMNGFLSLEVCYSQQCSRSHALYAGFPILLYASPLWPLYQALAYKHSDACSWYHAHFTIHCSFAVCQAYSGRYLYTVSSAYACVMRRMMADSSLPFWLCPERWFLARPDERETWPYHCSLRLFTMVRRSSCGPIACWILARTSSLVTWSLYKMHSILRQHLISMACTLLWSSAVRVHDSQACRKMDVTMECISRILGLSLHYTETDIYIRTSDWFFY